MDRLQTTEDGQRVYISPESERRYRAKYYQAHREECLERVRKYRRENPDKVAAQNKRYSMTHDRSEYYRRRWEARKNENKAICGE